MIGDIKMKTILITGIGGLTLQFGHNPVTDGPLLTVSALATALIVGLITKLIVESK